MIGTIEFEISLFSKQYYTRRHKVVVNIFCEITHSKTMNLALNFIKLKPFVGNLPKNQEYKKH